MTTIRTILYDADSRLGVEFRMIVGDLRSPIWVATQSDRTTTENVISPAGREIIVIRG